MENRNPPPSARQLLTVLGLFVGFIVGMVWLLLLLVDNLVLLVPVSAEQQLGKFIVPAYERLAEPSATQDGLNQLLDGLETELEPEFREGRDFRVLYVPEPTVNAIAIPGDRLVVYQGLLSQMGSENELVMVLGHELGHFAGRDHLRSLGRGLLLRAVVGSFVGDLSWLESAAVAVSAARFSQSQERQADEFGLELLNDYYGHVAGATDFFQGLKDKPGLGLAFFSSHPNPGDRVERLKGLIQQRGYGIGEKQPLTINNRQ
ncbi:MAG: M48 family metallopeptidase [Cyanobacteriota bacterium]|nr:M48 family metallopeptidase [Cyanobacteriota bacterium]